ncbi:Ethylene-responsive transcription factor-like protein [Striga hermonthica]|uniref:Ethylene-responsive transcription factor-like protein n=1 Tax=Striga hermonthica TaxID=68872 RepID=A0A9N7NZZ6_STRHE|nr:Ethylene-responsive transcription factor-like protein [Striga hermonthica]
MVSIRRRKLLAMCSGRNSLLAQLSWVTPPQISAENTKPITVHPLPLEDSYKPKEVIETALGTGSGSSNGSASSPSKDHALHQFPEIKRRKRHRRKQVENQEPCIMRGVYFKNLKWQAAIKVDKKQIHLGTVGSQEEAARLYDRAAFMCGREPNFELSEAEKQELRKFNWDEFLAITRSAITSKKSQRRNGSLRRKHEDNDWVGEEVRNGFSASEDDMLAP